MEDPTPLSTELDPVANGVVCRATVTLFDGSSADVVTAATV